MQELAQVRAGTGTLPSLREKHRANPADTKSALELASKLANRYASESIELCQRLMETAKSEDEATRARILFLYGYAESNRGGFEPALALWERVITEFPTSEGAADAAMMAGNVLTELPPERGLAFLAKAMPLLSKERRDELEGLRGVLILKAAEAECLRRGEAAGDDAELLNMAAWECFQRGWHTAQALAWARKAVTLGQRDPSMLDTLAHLLFTSGALDEALRIEAEALAKVTDAALRREFEESLAMWAALKAVREQRPQQSPK